MAIRLVVTRGFGNGTFNGTIKDVVRRGYEQEAVAPSTAGYNYLLMRRRARRHQGPGRMR